MKATLSALVALRATSATCFGSCTSITKAKTSCCTHFSLCEPLSAKSSSRAWITNTVRFCRVSNRARRAAERFGESGSIADGQALADACESLLELLAPHLSEEEIEVLPVVARVISPAEWGALPEHAFAQYSGTRIWLPFGLAIEAMPEDLLEGMREHLPPPVAAMWFGGGSDAFANEMAVIRQGAA